MEEIVKSFGDGLAVGVGVPLAVWVGERLYRWLYAWEPESPSIDDILDESELQRERAEFDEWSRCHGLDRFKPAATGVTVSLAPLEAVKHCTQCGSGNITGNYCNDCLRFFSFI